MQHKPIFVFYIGLEMCDAHSQKDLRRWLVTDIFLYRHQDSNPRSSSAKLVIANRDR